MSQTEEEKRQQVQRSLDQWEANRRIKKLQQELHDANEPACADCGAKPALPVSGLCALCYPKVVG